MRINKALLIAAFASFVFGVCVSEAAQPKVVVAWAKIKIKLKAPKRSALFDQLHQATRPNGPSAPDSMPAPVEEVEKNLELYGALAEGLDMEVEFTYAASNRTTEIWDENQGYLEVPKTKEVRPDIEFTEDGKYRVVIPTFNKGWFGAKYYLRTAKFTIYKGDAKPAVFEVRGDTNGKAIGVEQMLKVLVNTKGGRNGEKLSLDIQTYAGNPPNNVLGLPMGAGSFWLEIPIEIQG